MSGINNNFTQQRWPLLPPPRSFWWPQEGSGAHGAFGSYSSRMLGQVISGNPFNNVFNGSGSLLEPWALTEGSIIAGPLTGSPSFLLPILEVMTRDTPALPLEYIRDVGDDPRLALNEQNKASKKLRRVIYNPAPKRLTKRVSQYYKDGASKSSSNNKVKQDDEDEMRCAICLDDFEPKQVVLATPCDHMFHEDCIVPWVSSHGRCPVCRSGVSDQM